MFMTHRRIIVLPFVFAGFWLGITFTGCDRTAPPQPRPVQHEQQPDATGQAQPAAPYDGARSPSAAPPTAPSAADAREDDPTVASFLGVRAPRPATWIEHPPQSMMHHTTFTVPGTDGGRAAQIVVFFFGAGQGGPLDANIERWKNQFRSPDGYEVQPDVSTLDVDGMNVTLVELEGEYMTQGTRWYTPNQRFITAVVDTPGDQRIFIRFVGDRATVTANRDAFITMIEEMEWVGNEQ